MTLHEVKERIETAYNTEDWNIIEDVISALETVIMIQQDDMSFDDFSEEEDF